MAESLSTAMLEELAHADRKAYLEQRIFMWSPLGTFWTAFFIFVLLGGSYCAAAFFSHVPMIVADAHGWALSRLARSALVFSLLVATVLGIQRYARVRERADRAAFALVLKGGLEDACRMTKLTPDGTQLGRANIIGPVVGAVLCWTSTVPVSPPFQTQATYAWFTLMTVLTAILFARGVSLTRAGGRSIREMIDKDLIVDLLRIDRLSVIGRSAARAALIWFAISAVACLFFIEEKIDGINIALLVGCAAMGVWIFVATMERAHRKIRAAKALELERLRAQIDMLRHQMHHDADASQKLQGVLAYESRIADAQEWPFDQTTLVRVGASTLILTVPWFGQAVAGYLVEHFGAVPH